MVTGDLSRAKYKDLQAIKLAMQGNRAFLQSVGNETDLRELAEDEEKVDREIYLRENPEEAEEEEAVGGDSAANDSTPPEGEKVEAEETGDSEGGEK